MSFAAHAATEVKPLHDGKMLLRNIVLGMGDEAARVTDTRYDRYYSQNQADSGVSAVISAGRFFINGFPLPGTETAFQRSAPNGYRINDTLWLYREPGSNAWKAGYKGQKSFSTYSEAALAVATQIPPGLEVRLFDTDGDGRTDLIEADYKEGLQVGKITRNADATYLIERAESDQTYRTPMEGRLYDSMRFSKGDGMKIAAGSFDTSIREGDIALFWRGPEGWALQRAREVQGVFLDGTDHQSYNLDGVQYADAMRFSRDNLFISNRPGEYANALKYFGLNANREGLRVSLWLVPTRDLNTQGAPVGMTGGSSARALLTRAVAVAREKLTSYPISSDGKDVLSTGSWVTQEMHDQLNEAIVRADRLLADEQSAPNLLDYQLYLLYLTMNGSSDDIGARFGGYQYVGFDRTIHPGTRVPLQ